MKIISATALALLLPFSALLAQTEVAPPPEDLTPRSQVQDDEVDEKSRKAADDALNNFRERGTEQGIDVDALQNQAREVMEDAGVTEEEVEEVGRQIRDAARDAGVTEEDVEQATGALNERLDRAAEGGAVATEGEVEAALKALEELGAQAERALEDDKETLIIDDMASENIDATAELPATDDDILNTTPAADGDEAAPEADPREYPDMAGGSDNIGGAANLAESIMGNETVQRLEARRQEIFSNVNKERDAKNSKINFRRAMTRASADPEIAVLKDYAAEAATESEKRAFLRQYYVELFKKIRQLEPGIGTYTDEREREYLGRIDRIESGNDPAEAVIPNAEPVEAPLPGA